jgi:hypothetical protein
VFTPCSALLANPAPAASLFNILSVTLSTLLQDLQLCQPTVPADSAAAAGLTARQLQQHYAQLYDRLLEYSFSREQVQAALAALPKGSADVDACLDWLCYNLPHQQLPRRFRGGSRLAAGSEGIKVCGRVVLGLGFLG